MGQFNNDETLRRNYLAKWVYLVDEYELVKQGKHPKFRFAKDFYKSHGICAQNFLKYRGRYLNNFRNPNELLPQKRGPKWKYRAEPKGRELEVLRAREKGCSRYEIHQRLKRAYPKDDTIPKPSTIYRILKRYGKNRLTCKMRQEKRKFIKEVMGRLAHIDCHYLSKEMIFDSSKRYYLLCAVDSCTRVAAVELIEDLKSLTVMFATMRLFTYFSNNFEFEFEQVLTDNGAEFNGGKSPENHPFDRMLLEMGIKHRFIRPYRPQTNGRVERFWRTLHEDLIDETHFDSLEHFKEELRQYMLYYNHMRPHQALSGHPPAKYAKLHPNPSTQKVSPN